MKFLSQNGCRRISPTTREAKTFLRQRTRIRIAKVAGERRVLSKWHDRTMMHQL
jgi:hypothetical protein